MVDIAKLVVAWLQVLAMYCKHFNFVGIFMAIKTKLRFVIVVFPDHTHLLFLPKYETVEYSFEFRITISNQLTHIPSICIVKTFEG